MRPLQGGSFPGCHSVVGAPHHGLGGLFLLHVLQILGWAGAGGGLCRTSCPSCDCGKGNGDVWLSLSRHRTEP